MAVIGQIRKHSGWIVALIGLAILGFVVQDGLGNRQGKAPALGEVGGEKIFYQVFETQTKQLEEQYKRAQGENISLTAEDLSQIRNMAWERLLSNVLMNKACKRAGITVTKEEMNDMYYGEFISPILYNYFVNPQTGQYDRNQVMMIINNFAQLSDQDKQTLTELEKVVKEERIKEKYYYMVAKGYYIPTVLAEELAGQQSNMADATYVGISYSSIKDEDVKISEADYKKFYDENKHLFKLDQDSRDIDYVVWDVLPTEADIKAIEENVAKTYEEFVAEDNIPEFVMSISSGRFDSIYKSRSEVEQSWDSLLFNASPGTYFTPRQVGNSYQMAKLMDVQMRADSLRCSYLLIAYTNQAGQEGLPQRTKEEAKSLVDSLKNVVSGKTTDEFALVAAQYSDDPNGKQTGGDLGWQKDASLINFPAEARNAMLTGNVGDIKVLEIPNAYMLMKVTGKTTPIRKVLYCLISIPIEPSVETSKTEFTKASRFLAQCKGNVDFAQVCKDNKLNARSATRVDALADQLPGVRGAREIVRWAFKKEAKVGAVAQEVYELDNRYVVASIKAVHKKGYMSLDEIKAIPQVEYRVMRDAKADILMKKAEVANGSASIEQAAQKLGADAELGEATGISFGGYSFGSLGYEPELIGSVFGLKANVVSAPIKGNNGIYMIALKQMQSGEIDKNTTDMIRNQMQMMFQQRVVNLVKAGLEEDYSVVDNRSVYY